MVFSSPKCTSFMSDGVIATGFKRSLKCSLLLPTISSSLLRKTPSFSLMFQANGVFFLLQKWQMVCQWLESKISQDYILDVSTVSAADFHASTCRQCKEYSALFWSHALKATFFALIASFTSWVRHNVPFLPLFATPESFPSTFPSSRRN